MHFHNNNILTLKDKLFAIGEEIAESHIFALLLCSLPHSYDPWPENDLKLEFIKIRLTDEFTHRCENRSTRSNTRDAIYNAVNKINKQKNFVSIASDNHNKIQMQNLKNKTRKTTGTKINFIIIKTALVTTQAVIKAVIIILKMHRTIA